MHVEASEHPIVAAGPVVHIRAPQVNVGSAEPPPGLVVYLIAAELNRIVDRKPVPVTAIIFAVAVAGPIVVITIIAIRGSGRGFIRRRRGSRLLLTSSPEDIERVAF